MKNGKNRYPPSEFRTYKEDIQLGQAPQQL